MVTGVSGWNGCRARRHVVAESGGERGSVTTLDPRMVENCARGQN